MQKEICSKHVVVWHWIVFKTPTNLPLRSTQAKPEEERHGRGVEVTTIFDSYALFFSLSATVCQTSATSSLLQSSQLNRQRKNTRLISSAMRIVCVSRFSRKMPSPSLLLLLVPAVALGQQLVRIPVYCNSYVLYRWREVVLWRVMEKIELINCILKMEPRIVEPEERLAFANYTSRYYLHCHVSHDHLIFT